MTVKERLHRLVDLLTDDDAETAERVLEALYPEAGLPASLRNAPPDDESYTEEERQLVAEAMEDVRAGRVYSMEEVKRELGL